MLKAIALIGLGAVLALPAPAAVAQSGTTSGYGTQSYGNGPRVPTQSLSPFDRSWNFNNQSKRQARAGASWMREHHKSFPTPW